MKVRFVSVVAAGALSLAVGLYTGNQFANQQTTMPEFRRSAAFVGEVDAKNDAIVFVDEKGEAWVADIDPGTDLSTGDKCVLIFDDMGMPDIYDDELVEVF